MCSGPTDILLLLLKSRRKFKKEGKDKEKIYGMGKKKKVEPFASVISLAYPFASEVNKVAVFTGTASEIKIAEENGAAFARGADLVKKILDDEVVVDFYVAVLEIMTELNPLRKKLKKNISKDC
ncbi:39S ribosomal protein L1 [Cricetulus griseus]|nr:39S ribosomal protein L1 [Cricetulus griseus]